MHGRVVFGIAVYINVSVLCIDRVVIFVTNVILEETGLLESLEDVNESLASMAYDAILES